MKSLLTVLLSVCAWSSLILVGCGGNEVLLQPDYSRKEITEHRINNATIKVSKVIDNRTIDARTIGTARVGMFNKTVPYRIAIPVDNFVRNVYDSLFLPSPQAPVIPVIVFIDTFEVKEAYSFFSERGEMQAKMIFGLPVSQDSLLYMHTRTLETVSSGIDVTDLLESLVYQGVVNCGLQLYDTLRASRYQFVSYGVDSIPSIPAVTRTSIPGQIVDLGGRLPQAKEYSDIGLSYMSGGKIKFGVNFFYNMLKQKDSSNSMYGAGYGIAIRNIRNEDEHVEGTGISFGGCFVLRQLLSEANTSPYIGFQGTLNFGNETIDYGTHKKSSFYFGPLLYESFGVSINKKAFIEAGVYQILLIGSTMLPNDIGFGISISFGI